MTNQRILARRAGDAANASRRVRTPGVAQAPESFVTRDPDTKRVTVEIRFKEPKTPRSRRSNHVPASAVGGDTVANSRRALKPWGFSGLATRSSSISRGRPWAPETFRAASGSRPKWRSRRAF